MPAQNPADLVDEFKKSGEFDRLRRELLNSFRSGPGMTTLVARVEEIAKDKLASESKLHHMAEAVAVRELMQELERYPLIERAVADVPALTDMTLSASLYEHITSLFHNFGDLKEPNFLTSNPNESPLQHQNNDMKVFIGGPRAEQQDLTLVVESAQSEDVCGGLPSVDRLPSSPGSAMLESPPSETEENSSESHHIFTST